MLDHLDDPAGYEPDDAFGHAVRARARRHRTRRRASVAGAMAVVVTAGIAGALLATGGSPSETAERIETARGPNAPAQTAPGPSPSLTNRPFNVPVILTDDPGPGVPLPGATTSMDTFTLLRIDQGAGTLTALPLPTHLGLVNLKARSLVPLGVAYADAGAAGVAEAITQSLRIPVDYTVALPVTALASVVDALGGIDVAFPASVEFEDGASFPAGCLRLDGDQAVALARSATPSRIGNGVVSYAGDPALDRMERHWVLLVTLLQRLQDASADPASTDVAAILADRAQTSPDLGQLGFQNLVDTLGVLGPDPFRPLTLPVHVETPGVLAPNFNGATIPVTEAMGERDDRPVIQPVYGPPPTGNAFVTNC